MRPPRVLATALLLVLGCARRPAIPEGPTELEGLWIARDAADPEKETTLLVTGRRYHFQGSSRSSWYRGSFVLDTSTRPTKMDLRLEECEGDEKGKVVLAIYRLEKGALRLAAARPGSEERPRSFARARDVVVLEFLRHQESPTVRKD